MCEELSDNVIQLSNTNGTETFYLAVSTENVSRTELQELSQKYVDLIKTRSARKDGLDPIRLELAMQLFDECIRQVFILSVKKLTFESPKKKIKPSQSKGCAGKMSEI